MRRSLIGKTNGNCVDGSIWRLLKGPALKTVTLMLIAVIAIAALFMHTSPALAFDPIYNWYTDVPTDASYAAALSQLTSIGIFSGNGKGYFQPNGYLTREQFAKVAVLAANLADTVADLKGSTPFPDINSQRWSSGYINVAVANHYILGMLDHKFHPADNVTFAQACTVFVRMLGYTDQDLASSGLWPDNYISKAADLGLTQGIDLKSDDFLPRWTAAAMIGKLLTTDIKAASATANAITFENSTGLLTDCIVLDTPKTSQKLASDQLLTNKGILKSSVDISQVEPGARYAFRLDTNGVIIDIVGEINELSHATVINTLNNEITFSIDGVSSQMSLPNDTVYYYNGAVCDYDTARGLLQPDTSVVFAMNGDKSGYDYAVVYDPAYGRPQVADVNSYTTKKAGSIDLSGNAKILLNGDFVTYLAVSNLDVVYDVKDIWGGNEYILIVRNVINGAINGYTPSKLSPKSMIINKKSYDFSQYFDIANLRSDNFKIGDTINASLGIDGKIVSISY